MSTTPHGILSLARWAAVLSAVLMIAANSPARAATDVFVDGAGACAGQTPCFTTIQAGVNHAGPAPAFVQVFPGIYNESVDLGLMGSAIAGSAGNLTLGTVDSAGMPTHGGVSVLPTTGAALRNSLMPFPGTILIDGFTVKSPNNSGIALGSVSGLITLVDVVSDGNASEGFTASNAANGLSVANSSFSDNLGGDGMSFVAAVGVTLEGVTADGNSDGGATFSTALGVIGVTRSSFSRNKNGTGLSFATAAGVGFDQVTADENQNAGASFSVAGPVQVSRSSFSGAKNGNGLAFATATDVTFDDVTADNNQNTGATFSLTGALSITGSSFRGAKNGDGLTFASATDVSLIDVIADANADGGAVFSMTGALRVLRSSFSDAVNGGGLIFSTPSQVTFDQVSADGNQNDGATFSVAGAVDIASSSFSNAKNGDGLSISNATRVALSGVIASGNSQDGFAARLPSALIKGSRFEHNGRNGLLLSPQQDGSDFQLTCNDIDGNLIGLKVTAAAVINAAHNYWGSPSGPTHPSNPEGTGDPIVDGANGGAGTVIFQPFLIVPTAQSAFCQQRGAPVIQGHGLALLVLALLILPYWRLARRAAASRR